MWGLRRVRDADTTAAEERQRDEQAQHAACAMPGIEATDASARRHRARRVAQALAQHAADARPNAARRGR